MIAITVSDPVLGLFQKLLARLPDTVMTFESDGNEMEKAVARGGIAFVFDLAVTELITNPDRLTAAAMAGVPQIIVPGGLEHDPIAFDRVGKSLAEKACAARSFTRVVVPADISPVLRQVLRDWMHPPERLIESHYATNDEAFAELLIAEYIAARQGSG